MTIFLKAFFAIMLGATSVFSVAVFGPGIIAAIALGVAALVLTSVFIDQLALPATILTRILSILMVAALALLLAAGSVGGSFHLSESNEAFAFLMLLTAFTGLSSFCWKTGRYRSAWQTDSE